MLRFLSEWPPDRERETKAKPERPQSMNKKGVCSVQITNVSAELVSNGGLTDTKSSAERRVAIAQTLPPSVSQLTCTVMCTGILM